MKSNKFIKKIRIYAAVSFFLPLIAIISCLNVYKLLGQTEPYHGANWNEKEIEYPYAEYSLSQNNFASYTFANCPKYKFITYYITTDNQIIAHNDQTVVKTFDDIKNKWENDEKIENLSKNNKVKSVIIKQGKIENNKCVKNHRFAYLLLNNFNTLDKIFVIAKEKNATGFAKVKNPYLYGEVSISRTARYFPATLIFKPLIILSSIFLLLYWKNNLNFFKELENQNILIRPSKIFFYFGVFSCVFLILHASFLGIDFDSQLFRKIRKLIIILFIFFEISAQIFLTKNLFKFKEKLEKYINIWILKLKITFITVVLIITCTLFAFLVWGDLSTSFKHVLEWNYFSLLLIYYFLSRLLWKPRKTPVHTPEGA